MRRLTTLLACVVAAGCMHAYQQSEPIIASTVPPTTVLVQNQQSRPVTVFARQSGHERQLGVVLPLQSRVLDVPADMVTTDHPTVDIVVQPRSGTPVDAGETELTKGQQTEVVVPAQP